MRAAPFFFTRGRVVFVTFGCVLATTLGLVSLVGTDAPFHGQWHVEGQWLHPAWSDGPLHPTDFFDPSTNTA